VPPLSFPLTPFSSSFHYQSPVIVASLLSSRKRVEREREMEFLFPPPLRGKGNVINKSELKKRGRPPPPLFSSFFPPLPFFPVGKVGGCGKEWVRRNTGNFLPPLFFFSPVRSERPARMKGSRSTRTLPLFFPSPSSVDCSSLRPSKDEGEEKNLLSLSFLISAHERGVGRSLHAAPFSLLFFPLSPVTLHDLEELGEEPDRAHVSPFLLL